jgi:hypothetical protein
MPDVYSRPIILRKIQYKSTQKKMQSGDRRSA